jgi:hypothetical protein
MQFIPERMLKLFFFSEHKEGMEGEYWWIEIKCT